MNSIAKAAIRILGKHGVDKNEIDKINSTEDAKRLVKITMRKRCKSERYVNAYEGVIVYVACYPGMHSKENRVHYGTGSERGGLIVSICNGIPSNRTAPSTGARATLCAQQQSRARARAPLIPDTPARRRTEGAWRFGAGRRGRR